MPKKQSGDQKRIVGRVMHEFKHGELESAGGRKVRNPKQAIAIALHESGSSNQQSPAQNRAARKRTERRERSGPAKAAAGPSRAELYRQAQLAEIPGRSKLNKAGLQRALQQKRH